MSDNPIDEVLIIMLRLEGLGLQEGLKEAALMSLEGLGLKPDNAAEVWEWTVRAGGIRYDAWSQPGLSSSSRATAIAIKAERALALWKARRLAEEASNTVGIQTRRRNKSRNQSRLEQPTTTVEAARRARFALLRGSRPQLVAMLAVSGTETTPEGGNDSSNTFQPSDRRYSTSPPMSLARVRLILKPIPTDSG